MGIVNIGLTLTCEEYLVTKKNIDTRIVGEEEEKKRRRRREKETLL